MFLPPEPPKDTIGFHLAEALGYAQMAGKYFECAGRDSFIAIECVGAAAGHAFRAAELAYDARGGL